MFHFSLGLKYSHILSMLAQAHSIIISLSTLKRILRVNRLHRRKNYSDLLRVVLFIENKLNVTGGQVGGYRWLHLQCRHNGLNISRHTVQTLLQILDPVGVQLRLSKRLKRRQYYAKGPNYLWHLDSDDKLKRYGLCINGCMDRFSRCIIWLNVFQTSNDPKVIAGYFIESVRERKGCPFLMRGYRCTENEHVAHMQYFMTERKSFIYGRSTANQRIEMFWNLVRKQCVQSWMDVLGSLADDGMFDGYFLDKCLIQFCFLHVLQEDLDEMSKTCNTHQIRPTKNQNCPHVRPLVMYSLPALYGTNNYLHEVSEHMMNACAGECRFRGGIICDEDIAEHVRELLAPRIGSPRSRTAL
ncbi:uncharacterized protein LOC126825414 [Patella vulgata]|uniref:uncharacterized protein LOC126825414 n=1 Tax=Patella vulgata TaxID=6465 RepID=UPI00217F8FA3|nr:uncharacterized protein LOC126825414 [Patella vulgata]